MPRSKSNCSGALLYYLSAQIKQNSVFYANFQNQIINRFFGQAFSRKKSLRVEGGALVALRRERNPYTSCAPQGVNSKTVRWTVLEEGTPCKRGRAPLKHNFTILLYKHCPYPRSAFCFPLIPDRKKPHSRFENATFVLFMRRWYQYIPPIPPAPAAAAASAASAWGSFLSATRLSVVSTIEATEAAF